MQWLQGNRKLFINTLLALLAFILALASKFTSDVGLLFGAISGGFNWANASEHKSKTPPSE